MLRLNFNLKEFEKTLTNSVEYSRGFLAGAELNRKSFNEQLGKYTVEMLNKFIDTKARMSPDQLHHVYEWNAIGSPSARLFTIKSSAGKQSISFTGEFLPSKSVSDSSDEPFVQKASIMENGIAIEVSPKASNVLAFDINGETVFSMNSIYIANPGGDEVAGSFGKVIEDFFENFFTNTVLFQSGIMEKLSSPIEYANSFVAGAKGGGYGLGMNAGRKYLTVRGAEF